MRDIYDLIDEIEVDEEEITEMEVSEFEKEKVKKNLKKSINKKRRKKSGLIAASICAFVTCGSIILATVNPAYAGEVPFVGDIFRLIDNGKTGAFEKYNENANEINVTKESKGVSVTIKDAVFDGRIVTYTFEVKSDKDLGDNISFHHKRVKDLNANGKTGYSGYAMHTKSKKTGTNTYLGTTQITINDGSEKIDEADLIIELGELNISKKDDRKFSKIIKGSWKFNLKLNSIGTNEQIVNQSTEKDGISLKIDKLTITKMSFSIDYTSVLSNDVMNDIKSSSEGLSEEDKMSEEAQEMFNKYVKLKVEDDLGNEYEGSGNDSGSGDDETTNMLDTFGALDENASNIIITPYNSETTFDDVIVEIEK